MSRVYHEPKFRFRDHDQLSGIVDLQIFRRFDDKIVVVVSELIHTDGSDANRGVSAADGVEQIATVARALGFPFDYLIEFYPQHGPLLDLARANHEKREMHEKFHLVTLRWDDAENSYRVDQSGDAWAWKQISRADAEKIIGEAFRVDSSASPGAT